MTTTRTTNCNENLINLSDTSSNLLSTPPKFNPSESTVDVVEAEGLSEQEGQ